MPEIGNSLREARIRRGLSIKDVEYVTKIRSKYLEALEDDDFEVVPGPTYVKAYLRTYATVLKLDADALVDEFRRKHERTDEEPGGYAADFPRQARSSGVSTRSRAKTSRSRPGTGRSRTSSSGQSAPYPGEGPSDTGYSRIGPKSRKQRTRRSQRGYALVGVAAIIAVALLAWFGSGRGQDAASIGPGNITTSSSGSSVAEAGEGTTVPGAPEVSSTGSPTSATTGRTVTTSGTGGAGTTSGGDVSLVVTVTEGSCWLVVREDSESGAEIFAGTLSAGGEQTFDSSKRYWMLVGKPEVLALLVNNAAYTLTAPAGSFVVTEAGVERTE